jgi:CheY-like chemotaxis protein
MEANTHFSFVIVDDDKDDQELLLQAFKECTMNYDSLAVFDGSQLMNYLLCREQYTDVRHSNPDFIFLDINLPLKNGFEVLTELKSNKDLKGIPIYIFSTTLSPKDQQRMLNLGAKKCFTKPTAFADYKKMINEIVAD